MFFFGNVVRRKIRTHLDLVMILLQMYNTFRLLIGVPDYSMVVTRMEKSKNMQRMMGIYINILFRRLLFEEKSERT